jgi:hypothetical protein
MSMVGGRLDRDADDEDADSAAVRADLRQAYERGRLDERGRRRGHPFLMTLTVLCAVIGLVILVLAGVNGSFASGGAVVDRGISAAGDRLGPAAGRVADNARSGPFGGHGAPADAGGSG